MNPADHQPIPKMALAYIKISRAIVENLKTWTQLSLKRPIIQAALVKYDSDPLGCLKKMQQDTEIKQIFEEHLLEFNCWNETFSKVVEFFNKQKQVEGFNIQEKLISLQPKIRNKLPHTSYYAHLTNFIKKELKFQSQFTIKWRDLKVAQKNIKLQKIQQHHQEKQKNLKEVEAKKALEFQKVVQSEQFSFRDKEEKPKVQVIAPVPLKLQQIPIKVPTIKVEETNIARIGSQQNLPIQKAAVPQQRQRQKRLGVQKPKQQVRKSQSTNKLKKNKEIRLSNLFKYLDKRKDFNFVGGRQTIGREIMANLQRFMKQKMTKILKYSKLRSPGYMSDDAGDQFRMYSKKSTLFEVKATSILPETDMKFFKVKYPSKLQSYLRLRIEEEKQEEKLKNQLKQKVEVDKKVDRVIQTYIISDQKQNLIQFEKDQGPKKKQRLTVPVRVVQYVIQTDPWFGDQFIMDKSFYRGSS